MRIQSFALIGMILFIIGCTSSNEVYLMFRRDPVIDPNGNVYVDNSPVGKVHKVFSTNDGWYVVATFPDSVRISKNAKMQSGFSLNGTRNIFIKNRDTLYLNDGDSLQGEYTRKILVEYTVSDTMRPNIFASDSLIKKKALDLIKEYNNRRQKSNHE